MNKDEVLGIDRRIQAVRSIRCGSSEGEMAAKVGGHGGMDYIMLYRLLQCVRDGLAPDMDVYDAASWSAVGSAQCHVRRPGQRSGRVP